MFRNDRRFVKDARLNLECAMHRARASGVLEEQLANDSAVRAAGDRLTEAQASEHLRVIRTRLHAKRKKQDENDAHREQFESLRADAAQLSGILNEMVDSKELTDRGPKAVRATKLAKRIRLLLTEPEEICYRIQGGPSISR